MYLNTAFIAQILLVLGASILLILGVLHGVLTLQDLRDPRTFTPPDPALRSGKIKLSLNFVRSKTPLRFFYDCNTLPNYS